VAGRDPEETVDRPVVRVSWRSLTFLHWAYDPDVVQPLLPPGLEVDTWDGKAWVAITPFVMTGFRLPFMPPLPVVSTFPETNVRTYARGPDGQDGLVFLSLEVDSLPTFVGARATYWVPYQWARMQVDEGEPVRYVSRRRNGDVGHDIVVRPGERYGDGELGEFDHWLTGRWRAFTRIGGKLAVVAVQHERWPLLRVDVDKLDENLLGACGLPAPSGDPVAHFATQVDVRLGAPHSV
jgi:uncharacterized protein YqjF (DUF2071 family)